MRKIIPLILFFFCWTFSNAQTVSDADSQILEKIKQANIQYTTITSDFQQTKHMSILGTEVSSSGKFYYNKPEQMVMLYDDPVGDLMLINGNLMLMVMAGKRSEANSKSNAKMRGLKNILIFCMEGDVLKIGADKVTCSEIVQYYEIDIEVNTKLNKSNIKKVVVSYDKNDLTPSVLKTIEPDDSYTIYDLSKNKKYNESIDEAVFQAPKK